MDEKEADAFKPVMLYFDENNQITHTRNTIPKQMKEHEAAS
jgi:aspartate 1-decarboxylase